MKKIKQLVANLIYLSKVDLKQKLNPTITGKEIVLMGYKRGKESV